MGGVAKPGDETKSLHRQPNQESVKQKARIQSLFRAAYISSDSLHLITSSPTYRRDQLDLSISQISPAYRKLLANYKRLVSQKNELLRTVGGSALYGPLHELMAPLMIEISEKRRLYLDKIKQIQYGYFKNIGIVNIENFKIFRIGSVSFRAPSDYFAKGLIV